MRFWARLVLIVSAGCSFEASCGSKGLNMTNARLFLAKTFADDVGKEPDEVVCPDSVEMKKDATFECTARYGDAKATVLIRQDDDKGSVTIVSVSGILIMKKAEAAIAEQLGDKANAPSTASCGGGVRPANPGDTFTCKLTNARGESVDVEVTVKNREGSVAFKTLGPG
jgi:hypothetical protein